MKERTFENVKDRTFKNVKERIFENVKDRTWFLMKGAAKDFLPNEILMKRNLIEL